MLPLRSLPCSQFSATESTPALLFAQWEEVLDVVSVADEAQLRRAEGEASGRGYAAAAGGVAAAEKSKMTLSRSLHDALVIVKSTQRHAMRRETMGWFSLDEFVGLVSDPDVTV